MASRAPEIALCIALTSFVAACATASHRDVPPPVPRGADSPGGGAIGLSPANDDDITADAAAFNADTR